MPNIFIVEDEQIFAEDLQEILIKYGYRVCGCVPTGEEALREIRRLSPDLVLIDIVLAGKMTGIELADALCTEADIPFIYLTSNCEEDTIANAKCTRPYGYIPKPFDERVLFSTIEIALSKHLVDKQIRENENRYRTFVENIQGIAYRYDSNKALEFFHGAIEKITGYPAADFIEGKRAWTDIIYKDDRDSAEFPIKPEDPSFQKNRSREYRIVRSDGEIRWVHDQTQVLYRAPHEPLFEGVIYDITPLKLLETDLKKACDIRTTILLMSGHFFRRFLKKSSSGNLPDNRHAVISSLSEILGGVGYEMDVPLILLYQRDLNADNLPRISEKLRCVHPNHVPPVNFRNAKDFPYTQNGFARWDEQLLKGYPIFGTIAQFPLPEQTFFGDQSVTSVLAVPVFCEDRFWGFLQCVYFNDVHDWTDYEISSLQIAADVIATMIESGKPAEDSIRSPDSKSEEAEYAPPATLMDAAVDIVFVADAEGKVLHMNRAGLDFFGINQVSERQSLPYEDFTVFIRENIRDLLSTSSPLPKGRPVELELPVEGGKSVFLNLTLSPVPGSPGVGAGLLVMGIARDITRQKTIQKKLHLMQKIFRHDLNNQIAAILGYLSMSKSETHNPAFLGFIQKEERIVESIRKSLSFTRIYENLGDESAVWINVQEVFSAAWTSLARDKVQIDLPKESLEVCVDPLFRNVVFNLMDNSLRHGGENLSSIRVSLSPHNREMVILYEDNGAGILDAHKEKIFNRGFYTNNGFGLLLSREILSLTGLSIHETGIPGRGARFEITVPMGMWRFNGVNG